MNELNVKNYLPIGTVVLLKNATKRLMIAGYSQVEREKNETYDYSGCLYPEGIIASDKMALFNHNQIDKVFFVGYSDEEGLEFRNKLNDLVNGKEENVNNQ